MKLRQICGFLLLAPRAYLSLVAASMLRAVITRINITSHPQSSVANMIRSVNPNLGSSAQLYRPLDEVEHASSSFNSWDCCWYPITRLYLSYSLLLRIHVAPTMLCLSLLYRLLMTSPVCFPPTVFIYLLYILSK